VVASIANILKEKRSEILHCLKAEGRMSVDGIACAVGVSKVGIRRHLDLLSRDGLVSFETEQRERGRPGRVYFLTDKAELLFPNSYKALALGVIQKVGVVFGPQAVSTVLRKQADEASKSLKADVHGLSFQKRVKRLSILVDERGYNVSVRRLRDGSYSWKQRNCPLLAVANVYCQLCDDELRVYKDLLEAEVVRDCRIAAGAKSCDYRIFRPDQPTQGAGDDRPAPGGADDNTKSRFTARRTR
jgi:predicted ArsR family transcriptional regulator